MQISLINNLNFRAKFIDNATILKKDKDGKYQPCDVNFVEFDLKDKRDVNKVNEICSMPEFCSFGEGLREDINEATMPYYTNYKNTHCYALVKEKEQNYKNIRPKNVLGIFSTHESVTDSHPHKIDYFMTNSKYSNNKVLKHKEEYTGIGTGMVNAFKKMYPSKSIELHPAQDAEVFWMKNGFKKNGFKYINNVYMIYEP